MKYYVIGDTHGYYTEMQTALKQAGYFEDKSPHKIIICGDLFDRGSEAIKLQTFVSDLLKKDEIILIKGNHEDLAISMLNKWHTGSFLESHNVSNGTIDTILQLIGARINDLYLKPDDIYRLAKETPFIKDIIPKMLNFYETEHYIFVHGWIPCSYIKLGNYSKQYAPIDDWRTADESLWDKSRWINGMEACHYGITEKNKTIVCGHWHCSFGHANYEGKCGEFDNNPDFSPYYASGIIALDACTPVSGFVNCIVIED